MNVNTNLEKEFNLIPMSELTLNNPELKEDTAIEIASNNTIDHYRELDKIDMALPKINFDSSEEELDDLAEKALKAHQELMELSLSVEQRFIGEIASTASSMLASAITARTNKIKMKLDIVELQIKKKIADHKIKATLKEESIEADGIIMNRSELLDHLLGKKAE